MARLRKVTSGQRGRLSASDWNAAMDAARAYRESQLSGGALAGQRLQSGVILVQNTASHDWERFAVVEVTEPVVYPSFNESAFISPIAMLAVTPRDKGLSNIAVLQEPIAQGKIGRAMVLGVTAARVEIRDANHFYVDVEAEKDDAFISGDNGVGEILWFDAGPGESTSSTTSDEGFYTTFAIVKLGQKSRVGVLHTVIYRQKDDATGCIFVQCKETIGLPNQFDVDAPSVWAFAGPQATHVAGDVVMLTEVKTIPGFTVDAQWPSYFAHLVFTADGISLDEPVYVNTVHAHVPPPQPTPDPEPCLEAE